MKLKKLIALSLSAICLSMPLNNLTPLNATNIYADTTNNSNNANNASNLNIADKNNVATAGETSEASETNETLKSGETSQALEASKANKSTEPGQAANRYNSTNIAGISIDYSNFANQTSNFAFYTDMLYESFNDGTLDYIFVPSDADLANLVIHYNGMIKSSSTCNVDTTNSLITGIKNNQDITSTANYAAESNADSTTESNTVSNTESNTESTVLTGFNTNTTYDITDDSGNTKYFIIKKSDIPCISITLKDTDLSTVHANGKDIKYKNNSFKLTDPANSGNNLSEAGNVEFKGRGNSSWTETDKKGYQIKFEKKKSVLGMEKAKKWLLIANSSDPTLVRNATAFDLGKRLGMEETPDYAFVDLWINGEYRGNYMICEKIEIGEGRVNLSENGVIFELDGLANSDDIYFKDYYNKVFCIKDPDYADATERFNEFKSDLYTLEKKIATNPKTAAGWKDIATLLDEKSVIQMMLVNDYLNNVDAVTTSNYWYQDHKGGEISNGPLWDFDSANSGSHSNPSDFYHMRLLKIYNDLTEYSQFRNLYVNYYNENKVSFNEMYYDVKHLGNYLTNSSDMNYSRWQILGKYTDKGHYPVLATYSENINAYANWLLRQQSIFSCKRSCNYCVPVYRVFNLKTGEHLYTKSLAEKNHLTSGKTWRDEGILCYVPKMSSSPVFRVFNPNTGEHLYTMSSNEKNTLIRLGWRYEGIAWYSDTSKDVPIYRDCKPSQSKFNHNFTSSLIEHNHLTATSAWRSEGIAWYGCK
ncbi:CotH protein [Lachnospiraceae bacterium RM5]|nr:CotH protein [Lachnospiraceae bacterium RM5]